MKKAIGLAMCCASVISINAQAELNDWPGLYDIDLVPELNVKIKTSDWNTIVNDETFDIEVPALLWASQDGDESVANLVSIRRKSATPINGKVSFKIDINEYVDEDPRAEKTWHGVKKLSLENGDDTDVVSEGLAWYLHRLGVELQDTPNPVYPAGHLPGLANWATLTVHLASDDCRGQCDFAFGETTQVLPQGVYVNVEQVDKQFLKNRGRWFDDETWLFKQDDIGEPELKEAGCNPEYARSPILDALQCSPYVITSGKGRNKIEPADCDPVVLESLIDMQVMLGLGAVEAFSSNVDGMLTHGKNFFWADYSLENACMNPPYDIDLRKRMHYPWDLDAAIASIDRNVYGQAKKRRGQTVVTETDYQRVILRDYGDVYDFRTDYNQKLLTLSGQQAVEMARQHLSAVEEVLTPLLIADPNSKVGADPAAHFEGLRGWLGDRASIVHSQVCDDDPSLAGCR
ncbi:MAG: CotH kinase family protein [Gammaproteobacteria bacterium]